jgi:cholest-4-en-3-one 26-monooxygenase
MEAAHIDLLDMDVFARGGVPHEWFTWLRQNAPAYWHDEPEAPGFWVFSKYDDIVEISRNPQVFSSDAKFGGVIPLEEALLREVHAFAADVPLMLTMDPPEHSRYRKLVNRGFTPRVIRLLEPRLRSVAQRLVDAALAKGECDFVEDVAVWLPLETIAELVGVPIEDRHKIFQWANQVVGYTDPEYATSTHSMVEAAFELFMYGQQLCQQADRPGDDIIATLLEADIDGEQLSEMEFNLFFILLLVAGSETTRNVMAHGLHAFSEHPEQYRDLVEDPSLMPSAVEEMLRWATPVCYMRRTAVADTEIRGHLIKTGDKVTIWYISGNRDEDVFHDPFRFDIRRDPNPHMSFGGGGPHFCLGANLARLELRVMFEELTQRAPRFRALGPPVHMRSNMINGIKHFPVDLGAVAQQAVAT